MRLSNFKDWKISVKIRSLLIFVVVLFLGMFWFFLLPKIENDIINEKRIATRHLIEVAYSLISEYQERTDKGEFPLEEAQKRATLRIQKLRYGNNDYFWINDLTPKMIMHPVNPGLVGKDMSDYKDANGKLFLKEAVDICKTNGEGYVDYMWTKPGGNEPVRKVSYVKLYKPWGWIVGSGVYADDVDKQLGELERTVIITFFIMLIILYFITRFFTRMLVNPIERLEIAAEKISGGDLTTQVDINSKDEIGNLSQSFNKMKKSIKVMVEDFVREIDTINIETSKMFDLSQIAEKASNSLLNQANTNATSSQQISASVETVSSSAEEMSSSIKEISKHTGIASKISRESQERASGAQEVMNRLGVSSQEIGNILKSITSIAEQTNLLALNATIEAARAGEAGKGFAVVANEVKELAKESARASDDITKKIKVIQGDTSDAVRTINEIIENIKQINDISNTIASAVEEQSATTSEVNRNLSEAANGVNTIVDGNTGLLSTVNEFAQISEKLNHSAKSLKNTSANLSQKLNKNFQT
jgi:methyl-accepting chemotaxis protein